MKNFANKIFVEKRPLVKLVVFVFADAVLISLAVILSFFLRFEGMIPEAHFINIEGMVLFSLIILISFFYFSKMYYFAWNYVSADDLIAIVKNTTLGFLILTALIFILRDTDIFTGFPRSTIFVTYFLVISFVGATRFAKRIYLRLFISKLMDNKERILIVGAGDAGEQILRSINAGENYFLPVGFIDDNKAKQGVVIHGLQVIGKIQDIPKIVAEKNIKGIIIALPSAGSDTIREAVGQTRKAGLKKIKIVPAIGELIDGRVGLEILKDVPMEDLLGREPLRIDQKPIEDFIRNKKVLVTGAAGSIGSELCRQIIKFNPAALFLLDQDETGLFNISNELKPKFSNIISFVADVHDKERIEQVVAEMKFPEVFFHAAAYKHVPLMEENPEEAVKNNIVGTEILVEVSIACGAEKFVFISTDKAVNPTSVMGTSKRVGEMICQSANQSEKTKFVSVRFGNVANSRGSVIPIFKEKIQKREPIEITHSEMKRYFMTIPEACLLVLQAGAMGEGGEVFVLDMGDPIKIMDLAKELIRLSGLEPDKDIPIVLGEPRPGEKFFEEILTAEEGTIATQNQKIFIAKLSKVDKKNLEDCLETLKEAAKEGEKEKIRSTLKNIVPSFHPSA